MTDYLKLAREVGEIARQAGAEILEIYNTENFGVELKADDSPLTLADKSAHKTIEAGLQQLTFQAPLISEESPGTALNYATRSQLTRFWLVDPLDGTKEFIKRNDEFTVNIALIEGGKPVLGVVFVPVSNELFYAAQGQGAYEVTAPGEEARALRAASYTMQDANLRVIASRSHLNEATTAFIEQLDQPQTLQRGSSLKIMELARGNAHLYPRLAPTMEWDTAAAHAILLEAGGHIISEESGQELRYNKQVLRNPHFVAYGEVREAPLAC